MDLFPDSPVHFFYGELRRNRLSASERCKLDSILHLLPLADMRQAEEDADAEFKWSFTAKHARRTLEDAHAEFKMSFTAKHGRITDLSISFPGSLRSFEIEAITSSLLNKKIHEIKDWKDALFLSLQEEETNPETYLERQLLPFHVGESMNDLFLVPKTYSGKREDG